MKLIELLNGIEYSCSDKRILDEDVKDIKINHNEVEKGDLFIALKGENFDGDDFVMQAREKGAKVVISEKEGDIIVKDARSAYAITSKHFFFDACDKLKIIAVTGTNGKTTVTNIVRDILSLCGGNVAVIGTLGAKYKGKVVETGFTTPDPYILHKLFYDMSRENVEFVVMEASAHALALNKLDGIKFEIALLTNITEDHLDYFKNMDNYAMAKFKLFESGRAKLGIVNIDDSYGKILYKNSAIPTISFGFDRDADVYAENVHTDFNGSEFKCNFCGEKFSVKSVLVGKYNVENILSAIAITRSLGLPAYLISLGLGCTLPVEGRFNVVQMNGVNIIIDYAHTPDGLKKVLQTAKQVAGGRLVVIFGCGGNREMQKRKIMGQIASENADEIILTSDNPRFEDPHSIIMQIKEGVTKKCKIIENRKDAIEYALSKFHDGETIVIAGKGGEKYQEIEGEKIPYNDFDVVYNFYRSRLKPLKNDDFIAKS